MTEQEAIRIISDGHWNKHEILHAARYILGVMRERERVWAKVEQVNHELIKAKEPAVRSGGTKKCTVPENKECHALHNGMCMNAFLCDKQGTP